MFYIYILYSSSADKYYVGYTSNPVQRLKEHNEQEAFNTYTSKFRPWQMAALFECGTNEDDPIGLERFIKKQKSRKLLELLCDIEFTPTAVLAQLVRVPHVRD